MKEKWKQQEDERKKTENQYKEGKLTKEENIMLAHEGISSEVMKTQLPEMQTSDYDNSKKDEEPKEIQGETPKTEKQNKAEEKKLKDENYKQMKLEKAEAKKAEEQNETEAKKIKTEKLKHIQLSSLEKQKTLKEKWIKQEQDKKENQGQLKKEKDTIRGKGIPAPEGSSSKPAKDGLQEVQICEDVNPFLIEYAQSISSDIMKEAKGKNALKATNKTTDELEPEVVGQESSEKSSKDEGIIIIVTIYVVIASSFI